MALNPLLKSLVERSQQAHILMQELERLEADLRLAKAEVKAARLEVRLLTARRAQAQATVHQSVPAPRTIRPADPDIERFQAELDDMMKV